MKVYAEAPQQSWHPLYRQARRAIVAALAVAGFAILAWTAARGLDAVSSWWQARPLPRLHHADVKAPAGPPMVLPPSDPNALEPVSLEKAVEINAAIPLAAGPNPAAAAWLAGRVSDGDLTRSVDCLAAAIYYEAASEPIEGQEAVAQVVLNRVRHPAFPHTVCGTVFQGSDRATGCQFSFTCDGSLGRTPSKPGWAKARAVAEWALSGHVYRPIGWATHYHANYVVPYWSSTMVKVATINRHIFYRWRGGWGTPPAFSAHYAGGETDSLESVLRARLGLADVGSLVDPSAPAAVAPSTERPVIDNLRSSASPVVAKAMPGAATPVVRRWVVDAGTQSPPPITSNGQAPAAK